jgi:hypothetical protein
MAKKKSSKPKAAPAPEHPGSERHADQQREGGPRYHGSDWEQAAEDEERGRLTEPQSADTRTELEAADEEIADPGTRGAVFGRGGKGIVERDEPDDLAGISQVRDEMKHGSRPPR